MLTASPHPFRALIMAGAGVGLLVLTSCGSPAGESDTAETKPFAAHSSPAPQPLLPVAPSTQNGTWLEVDGGWQGRVMLPDSGTSRCSVGQLAQQRWFEAVTSEFTDFDSGGADPGHEFDIHATVNLDSRPERGTQPERWVVGTFVDSAGAHVQFHSTDEIEVEVRDDGRQVAFALTALGSGLDIAAAPLTVRGVITCDSVTEVLR
ncbi:hypothetical protein [Rhodococcus pyridinivorans]|uniref:hypothetical protein n=1 Tax=Rhodococcus pyridinivorans TaxID=103816 RepID=UPI002657BC6B|nr:hypothetical protein [Rhodococcus pyridinivorans]